MADMERIMEQVDVMKRIRAMTSEQIRGISFRSGEGLV